MYQVLLVDDEVLIREAISESIRWNELGYELTAACKNGKEAIEKIKECAPDLVLTDICMPYVDGIELAKYVYENCPQTRVVIISGYEEFEYAKNAMQYRVIDYILKPITMQELSEKLVQVRDVLDEQNTQKKSMERIRSAYKTNLPIMRSRYLTSLIHGTVFHGNIEEKIREYQINLLQGSYMVAVVVMDDASTFQAEADDRNTGLANFAIYNITAELLEKEAGCVAFQDAEGLTLILFSGSENTGKAALKLCEKVHETLKSCIRIVTTIGIGKEVCELSMLPQTYHDAQHSLEFRFQLGGDQVIYSKNLQESGAKEVDVASWSKELSDTIRGGDRNNIKEVIQDFTQVVRETYSSKGKSIFYMQSFLIGVLGNIDQTVLNQNNLFDEERELVNTIFTKNHLSEVAEELRKYFEKIVDSMIQMKEGFCKNQAALALEYIDRNYGNTEVSLNTVCAHLAMSTSYFSSIFKSYTGETFIETLTKKRISRAKELLETTSMKTYEIADKVGYSDPHYFSSTFKKMTGMTPTEYAKKMR